MTQQITIYSHHLSAFRFVFYLTIVLTILLVIIDPLGGRLAQQETGLEPWTSKWFIVALIGFLFLLGICGRGRVAWIFLVIFVIFSGLFRVFLYFQDNQKVSQDGKSVCLS